MPRRKIPEEVPSLLPGPSRGHRFKARRDLAAMRVVSAAVDAVLEAEVVAPVVSVAVEAADIALAVAAVTLVVAVTPVVAIGRG